MRNAIFGGTFDPIHTAHLIVAREAADAFSLDRVLFIPAAHPPHKNATTTPYEHRYRMVELACAVDPRFVASRLEEGQEKSYSFYTIERVKRTLAPADVLYFLIGADAFAEIDTWHRSAEVLASVRFLVVTRPGHEYRSPDGAQYEKLETLALPVSSSEVRQKLAAGVVADEVPAVVVEYIRANGLYGV
ncbi:MAG: nicotinate (nicotinamide) nucleotide adenylyltransferase [Acidobacteria bacterium]|nr:nicotinate (nicotinamide) nucleotide adenylyltransferase [Acidobacteriota bacterium]